MRAIRSATSLVTFLVLVLFAFSANATWFTFAGKFTSNRGRIINIPAVGNVPCRALKTGPPTASGVLTVMTNFADPAVVPQTMTPYAMITITRGVNTQPVSKDALKRKVLKGIDLQCVAHVPNKLLMSTGTMAKVGGAFTLPDHVWYDPFPTMSPFLSKSPVPAVEVKYVTGIAQLATSFRISGPRKLATLMSARAPGTMVPTAMNMASTSGGTMATMNNLGPWLKFQKLSMLTATKRSGRVPGPAGSSAKFTWCPAAPGCVNIAQAPAGTKAILKYYGTGNQFTGTMSYMITTGPGVSSLALNPVGPTGFAAFLILAGSGSQPTGRGYAQFGSDMLASGPQFSMHMEKVVTKPIVGMQKLFTTVMGAVGAFPKAYNLNYGFPFTTMKVLARNTGTALGNPMITTLTAQGSDVLTGMGGRNIQLVAGGIGITTIGSGTQTPELATMFLTLPEPGRALQMFAGVIALLGVAGWRARKRR